MKRELLERAVAAGDHGRPIALVRGLETGQQWLIDEQGAYGDTDRVSEALLREARGALARDGGSVVEISGESYLIQSLSAPPRLIVIGAVHIAQKLVPMAQIAGYDVYLIDPRASFASPQRFADVQIINEWPQEAMKALRLDARTAVVTLSHDAKIDEPALQAALRSDAFYIGALGSKKNHAKRLQRLAAKGFDETARARIAGPIGLVLGGRSPAEIAVAILAQLIQARYRQRTLE